MLQDLRFAFRLIFKERWYTVVAVVTLALGIGVNATGFAIVNGAFLRGPAFRDSQELFALSWQTTSGRRSNISHPEFEDLRAGIRSFEAIAAFNEVTVNISDDTSIPEQAEAAMLTANAFSVLGQAPLIGRDFVPGEDQRGAPPVVLLGYRLWKNRYSSDPSVLGKLVRINGQPATIIGVMPDRMNFPTVADLWTTFIPTAEQEQRDVRPLTAFGRLNKGATQRGAQAELRGIAHRLASEYPDINKDLAGARVETLIQRFVGGASRVVFPAVMGAAGFVLLIACANVANLLLSRSVKRSREIAVRIALGASRQRVLRQLLLESIFLGCLGGSVGVFMTMAGVRAIDASITDTGKPYWIAFDVDYTVLTYVVAICVLTGIIFGIAPALHVSKTNVNDVLKQCGRGTFGGRRARRFSTTMVVAQLALTIVLLVGAGLMIRSFFKMYMLDIGIRTERLMAMRLQLADASYGTPDARRAFFDQIEPRLQSIPGVESIAISTSVPPLGGGTRQVEIEGQLQTLKTSVTPVTISPRFFDVVGIQPRSGRIFGERDGLPGLETVIINERMAALFLPGEDPLGKRLRFVAQRGQPEPVWRTIVGVTPSIRHGSLSDEEMTTAIYLPYRQDPPRGASLLIRSDLPPASVMAAVGREVQLIDRDQSVFAIQTLDQMLEQNRWGVRVFGSVFAVFAGIALVMSAVGLYAVMSYDVTQRTQEIGVRMALGAKQGQVSWMILRRGLTQLAIGLAVGLAGALALGQVLQSVLVQVTPADPVTFVAITILLASVSVAACMIPMRRAMRVDPVVALRNE